MIKPKIRMGPMRAKRVLKTKGPVPPGLARYKARTAGFTFIPQKDQGKKEEGAAKRQCISRAGVERGRHYFDRDLKCVFCDYQAEAEGEVGA